MLETVSKVLTLFKVDTSEMKAGLKELTGEEKKLHQAQLDAAEDRNKGYDGWIKKLGDTNQALELVGRAVGFARDTFKAYSEDLRLRAAAGKVSIDALHKASMGLRSEQELLAFAAKAQHGVMKVSEEQMATAQRAMVALTRAGFDQEEVTQKITDALIKAKGEGLDDFGIAIKKGKTEVEDFNNLMAALAQKANGVQEGSSTAAEGVDRMAVSMRDSIDKMKQSLGQLVASMAPLLNALARAVGIIADLAKGHADVEAEGGVQGYMLAQEMKRQGKVKDPETGMWVDAATQRGRDTIRGFAANADSSAYSRSVFAQFQSAGDARTFGAAQSARESAQAYSGLMSIGSLVQGDDPWGAKFFDNAEAFMKKMRTERKEGKPRQRDVSEFVRMGGMDTAGAPIGYANAMGEVALYEDATRQLIDSQEAARQKALTEGWMKELGETRERRQSYLEAAFGPIEQFDAYRQGFETLGATFSVFADAMGSGYEAIVTGQAGLGQAIKKTMADGLLAIGKSSVVEALRQTALGLGALAFGSPTAAMHFKSAAMHGAVAVAAGLAANAMGAGGSSGGGASASGGSGSGTTLADRTDPTRTDSQPGKETLIVTYLDPFANLPEYERRRQAKEMVRNVTGNGIVENS